MKRTIVSILGIILFLALAFSVFPAGVAEETYSAGTMRLLRYEGDVEILDTEGVPRFVLENVRFDSGESMRTGEESLASVGMDESGRRGWLTPVLPHHRSCGPASGGSVADT